MSISNSNILEDYLDADLSYLLGLIVGRGIIKEGTPRQILVEFPFSSLHIEGIDLKYNQEDEIKLGIETIRERIQELVDTDIKTAPSNNNVQLVISFLRNSMTWRNIRLILGGGQSYVDFELPKIFLTENIPPEWKREFMRGFADVAGNIRRSNRYTDNRNRVRLDVLNYPTSWSLPVQLCELLQIHLQVPVQNITYGHPNMNRGFREHQINIFAVPFLKIGFSFRHKQALLEELAESDIKTFPSANYSGCPGRRKIRDKKIVDPRENDETRLDPRLVGKHFDGYWQICKALGCTREPVDKVGIQASTEYSDDIERIVSDGDE